MIGRTARLTGLTLVLTTSACAQRPEGPAQASPQPRPERGTLTIDTVATGLVHPWAVALIPDGRFIVTERGGQIRVVDRNGTVSPPLAGVPAVAARSQGGLLDVAIDPQFTENQRIFFSYSEPGPGGTAGTSVARARLTDQGLQDLRVIYRQEPKVTGGGHFGSRLVFSREGLLFITQGDRFSYREQAQNLDVLIGKIVRVTRDGEVPRDNPFVGRAGARPEIWSYGHRNVQAAALDPATGQLWTVEHGAAGGDELNHPEAGKNYGWPVITYGRDYNGRSIGEGASKEGMEQPVYYWDPVIAPSGMIFYSGDKFPGWRGNILIGGLASQALVRLVLRDGRVTQEIRYLGELGQRIRDVQEGSDGFLYVVTDEDPGALLRLRPR
jgi:glucose/arabinose dehydrogenase